MNQTLEACRVLLCFKKVQGHCVEESSQCYVNLIPGYLSLLLQQLGKFLGGMKLPTSCLSSHLSDGVSEEEEEGFL